MAFESQSIEQDLPIEYVRRNLYTELLYVMAVHMPSDVAS